MPYLDEFATCLLPLRQDNGGHIQIDRHYYYSRQAFALKAWQRQSVPRLAQQPKLTHQWLTRVQ
jgi:hypothetical protein